MTRTRGAAGRSPRRAAIPLNASTSSEQPLERRRLLDEVTDRILAHIRDEGLRPGDRLPSNRALSEQFLVATPTLREALRRLEATGGLELRHGSGVYVRADLARLIMANPNRLQLDHQAILDLLEARELIEPYLAEAAARNATEAEIDKLATIPDRAAQALDDDQAAHTGDIDFHRNIAGLAGNRALAQVLEILVDLHDHERRHILTRYDDRDQDHRAHRAILAAVRARNPRRAGRLMREHLRELRAAASEAVPRPAEAGPRPASDG